MNNQSCCVLIDFKIVNDGGECWHETYKGEFLTGPNTTIRDVQECALKQYMWRLKEETIKELHTK